MEIENTKRSLITEELPSGYTTQINIDYLDEDCPFEITIGTECHGWWDKKSLTMLKTQINAALRLYNGD